MNLKLLSDISSKLSGCFSGRAVSSGGALQVDEGCSDGYGEFQHKKTLLWNI